MYMSLESSSENIEGTKYFSSKKALRAYADFSFIRIAYIDGLGLLQHPTALFSTE